MLMVPIDTGNKAIKTEHFEFHSGISVLEDIPGEGEEAVNYQGRYYRLSSERNVYLPDKSGSGGRASAVVLPGAV